MNWIGQLLQGTDGSPSTMRVGVLVVICGIVFEHAWATVHGTPQAWDWGQVVAVVGALGAKSVQRAFEGKPDCTTPAAAPATPTPKP